MAGCIAARLRPMRNASNAWSTRWTSSAAADSTPAVSGQQPPGEGTPQVGDEVVRGLQEIMSQNGVEVSSVASLRDTELHSNKMRVEVIAYMQSEHRLTPMPSNVFLGVENVGHVLDFYVKEVLTPKPTPFEFLQSPNLPSNLTVDSRTFEERKTPSVRRKLPHGNPSRVDWNFRGETTNTAPSAG